MRRDIAIAIERIYKAGRREGKESHNNKRKAGRVE